MARTSANTFINLSVKDIQKTNAFFKKLGFAFDEKFSDESTSCMILNSNTFVLMTSEAKFQGFIRKEIADASRSTEVILALSAESREKVDEIVDLALEAGGKPIVDPVDYGWMYYRTFYDLDGHHWEVAYIDESSVPQ